MRRLIKRFMPGALPDWAIAFLVAVTVAGIVIGLRVARVLEPAEMAIYDRFLRVRAPSAEGQADPRILIVTVTERDIQEQGAWPLSDGVLARTINTLLRLRPRAIGLDIYRDVPIAPGTAELDYLLSADFPIVVVTKFVAGAWIVPTAASAILVAQKVNQVCGGNNCGLTIDYGHQKMEATTASTSVIS
jgi:CHASE2 domain-containing sensor protein